jgi:hypothetical protein
MDELMRAALAHHEAGHAVVNVAGGLIVDGVTLTDDRQHTSVLGLDDLEEDKPGRDEYRRRAEPFLIGQLAGALAERRYTGQTEDSGSDDRQNAAWLAIEIHPDSEDLQAYLDRMSSAAKAAVDANWKAIERVARRLIEDGRVSEADLHKLIAGT